MKKPEQYDPKKIEKKWQKRWAASKIYKSKEGGKRKYYVLDMFPYPSGEGLHVGHPKGYIATDVVSRMKRMQGMNVLHPMGFDAFGLPAENYAIKTKTNPEIAVKKNVARYKKQLELLGFDYDWSREVNTTDPGYYRWTQWAFLQMWKKGLAYESNEPINWCPSCKTGLANEDIEDGRCERCGTPVEKKKLRQWVLKITDYADRLLYDLDAKKIPLFVDKTGSSAVRKDAPWVERNAVIIVVEHWSENKFIGLKWKQVDWNTLITGGIEPGQTAEDAARAEIQEETGYKNIELVAHLGKENAHFYQVPKKENRNGHFDIFHFRLKNGDRNEVTDDEKAKHEVVWIPRNEMHDWLTAPGQKYAFQRYLENSKGINSQNVLNWPESIKELQRNWIGRSEGAQIDFRLIYKNRKVRFVLIHGYQGGPDLDFFPWLKAELEKRGHEVDVPALPNPFNPNQEEQVNHILNNCKFDENTVVVAHSLGCVSTLQSLMKAGKKVAGLVLVAPAAPADFMPKSYDVSSFSWDFNYEQIRNLTGDRLAILSDSQEPHRLPYIQFLAGKLSCPIIEVKANKEHFTDAEEPEILLAVTPNASVYTTRPDTVFGVTYLVLAPDHPWVAEFLPDLENKPEVETYLGAVRNKTEIERTDATREKTGVELKGIKAINPANKEEVPVWIADYVLADYGTGAVMAVPAHDERDYAFAKKFNLEIREVVRGGDIGKEAFVGQGTLVNSGKFNDRHSADVLKEITDFCGGKWVTKFKLRDWVFSRQRYWGEPIPLIHCENCGVVAVPDKDLPVKLPKVKYYEPTGTGESPLAAVSKWVRVKCPQCGGKGRRETNTMPQWAGSCWYYLRYEDPVNKKRLVDSKKEKYWSPVDLYVGGAEHATRHLIYARFWHKFLFDIGVVSESEPFTKLQSVGLIMGEDGRKMSKRFGNVVNPDEIVENYGADTLRLYEMFMGPFDQQISWSTSSMVGARRFIERVWKLSEKVELKSVKGQKVAKIIQKTVKKVTEDIENLRFNTAISSMMIALNEIEKQPTIARADFEAYLKLLSPFAPHVTEELWARLSNKKSIHISGWPAYDEGDIQESEVKIIVQVNGKVRGSFMHNMTHETGTMEAKARELPEVKKWTDGKEIKKTIVIPGRLVNIVT